MATAFMIIKEMKQQPNITPVSVYRQNWLCHIYRSTPLHSPRKTIRVNIVLKMTGDRNRPLGLVLEILIMVTKLSDLHITTRLKLSFSSLFFPVNAFYSYIAQFSLYHFSWNIEIFLLFFFFFQVDNIAIFFQIAFLLFFFPFFLSMHSTLLSFLIPVVISKSYIPSFLLPGEHYFKPFLDSLPSIFLLHSSLSIHPIMPSTIFLNTKKYHVFAPKGRFHLESIYLYFPPSSQQVYLCFCPVGLSLL